MITVRSVTESDRAAWLEMRLALWPEGTEFEHRDDIARFFAGASRDPVAVLVAWDEHGQRTGFAELSIRPWAEGCGTDHVAYLEGWYVVPNARRRGVGAALIAAAEEWGRRQGCTEFGSDAEADNTVSAAAHLALGFSEVGLLRCFRKEL